MSRPLRNTLIDGFNKFVIKNPEGCWGWKGCVPKDPGYGQFRVSMKLIRAHRASWEIYFGKIPKGKFVLHRCDNRICSNPDHLFIGTPKDNIYDAFKKGRHKYFWATGEKNHMSKLKESDVIEIKKLISLGLSNPQIVKKFNVHVSRISDIRTGRAWSKKVDGRAF